MMSTPKHTHYYYSLCETFARRTVEQYDTIQHENCRSTAEMFLVGGGQDHCSFVTKQKVKYAASRTNQYQTPTVKKPDEQLVVNNTFVSKSILDSLFKFTFHMDMEEKGGASDAPSAKRMKIEVNSEVTKNEIFCKTLRDVVKIQELVIDTGIIDDTLTFSSLQN